ncbi:MAG: hypothetical protein Q8M76_03770 [Spirochaetaceae bacterium]|nr:hypothetical protein [Spirochaetaceae bacterium]
MKSIVTSLVTAVFLAAAQTVLCAQGQASPLSAFAAVTLPKDLGPETADLVVRGRTEKGVPLNLDMKTIMALPSVTFRAFDPWDGVEYDFTGVSLKDFMAWVGIKDEAKSLVLTARNSYTIPIKRSDYEKNAYYIVYMIGGKLFADDPAAKQRGPLAIAIDFAASKGLPIEIYRHQLVWKLADIVVQ